MNEPITLSELGRARKQEILSGMARAAAARRRRRRARIALAVTAPLVALAVLGATLGLRPAPTGRRVAEARPAPAHPAPPAIPAPALVMHNARFEIAPARATSRIQTLPGELTLPVDILDDEGLSTALRAAGKDPGVVRTGAGVRVLAAVQPLPAARP